MQSENKYQFVILGLGSIGKRHAEFLSSYNGHLICIDPNEESRNWCISNLKSSTKVFSKIEDAKSLISESTQKKIGVISNWGNLHFQSAVDLINLGVTNLYIEKPIVNSLKALDYLKNLDSKIKIIGGFQNRYTDIDKQIKEISSNKLGGNPSMISVNGGAAGIVTNGIHYLDLAISIFNSSPKSVFSNLFSSNINPRSSDLDFWEGTAYFNFTQKRSLIINFTNLSSVRQTTEIFCPNGKIKINEDMSLSIFERDQKEIEADKRITRLGVAKQNNEIRLKPNIENLYTRIFEPFFDVNSLIDIERELVATKGIIYALASNKMNKILFLDDDLNDELYKFEWKIS